MFFEIGYVVDGGRQCYEKQRCQKVLVGACREGFLHYLVQIVRSMVGRHTVLTEIRIRKLDNGDGNENRAHCSYGFNQPFSTIGVLS